MQPLLKIISPFLDSPQWDQDKRNYTYVCIHINLTFHKENIATRFNYGVISV